MSKKKYNFEKEFLEALEEMSDWERNLTHVERTTLTVYEARQKSVNKIFLKYKKRIMINELLKTN